jgi:hypothetical protein
MQLTRMLSGVGVTAGRAHLSPTGRDVIDQAKFARLPCRAAFASS